MAKNTGNPKSRKRIKVHIHEGVAIGNKNLFRHRSPGRANYDIQHIEGDSFYRDTGKWNWIRWVINRVGRRYQKRIIDGETREIIRDNDKPLPERRNHGSARKR